MANRFIALETAEDAAAAVLLLVHPLGGRYAPLADQARRAAASAALNLAEGAGRCGRDRIQHYRIAYGSAREAACALRLLTRAGQLTADRAAPAMRRLDEVCAITWRLAKMRTAAR